MKNKVRVGKQNRHEKVTEILLQGERQPDGTGHKWSPEAICAKFKGTEQERLMYRLSTNIYNLRQDGGAVKVYKEGRNVTFYQLLNCSDFDSAGRFIQKADKKSMAAITSPEDFMTAINEEIQS